MGFKTLQFSLEEITILRKRYEKLDETTSFSVDIKFASKIASYGLLREIGTVNDELARFIFNVATDKTVRLESLKAELVTWNGLIGLRIYSTETKKLELRKKGIYELIHPQLSTNDDGTLHSLFIFPEIINEIVKSEEVELVLVKPWGLNTIFDRFNTMNTHYQTNFWEIENNDALRFSDLIRQGKLAFMGTHDFVSHIAGLNKSHWPLLRQNAERAFDAISMSIKTDTKPSISALILPYTIGVVLDDLAQPPSYSSKNHIAVLNELLSAINKNEIPVNLPTILTQFPENFQKIIELSRIKKIEDKSDKIRMTINSLIQEILKNSFTTELKYYPKYDFSS